MLYSCGVTDSFKQLCKQFKKQLGLLALNIQLLYSDRSVPSSTRASCSISETCSVYSSCNESNLQQLHSAKIAEEAITAATAAAKHVRCSPAKGEATAVTWNTFAGLRISPFMVPVMFPLKLMHAFCRAIHVARQDRKTT